MTLQTRVRCVVVVAAVANLATLHPPLAAPADAPTTTPVIDHARASTTTVPPSASDPMSR